MCSGRVSSSCSNSGNRRVNIVTHPVISREWGKTREVFTTSGTYPCSFGTQIFHNGQPSHGGDRNFFEVMTSKLTKRNPWFSSFLVSSNSLSRKSWSEPQALEYRIIWEIYIYSICRCCWNVATYKWKVHNGKIEIISFVVKFRY